MISGAFRKAIRTATVVGVAITVFVVPSTHASATQVQDDDGFSVAELDWSQSNIDARGGSASATLDWTIVNDDPEATTLSGEVFVRMADARFRTYIGEAFDLDYRYGATCCHDGIFIDGTPQRSSYRATVPIPQYARKSHVIWVVTRMTAAEEDEEPEVFSGESLEDFDAHLRATTLVDRTPPTVTGIGFSEGPYVNPYLYVNGAPADKGYAFRVTDPQSGFWKGSFELAGPTGQTSVTTFDVGSGYSGTGSCSNYAPQPTGQIACFISARLPADAAEGAWRVTRITVVDSAGNRATTRDPEAPTLTVTGNRTVRATSIVADPIEVDNWRHDGSTTVTVTVVGAQGEIEHAEVVTNWQGGGCYGTSTTPAVNPDGTLALAVVMETDVDECAIEGLILRDAEGNVAVYGEDFHGPELSIPLTRVPDPTPPQVRAAALSHTTVPLAEVPTTAVTLTVTSDTEGAPIEFSFVSLYDSVGSLVCGASAARVPDERGVIVMKVYIRPDIAVGTYTVGLSLRDTLKRTSDYGSPNGLPMPGRPLTITITA